MLLMKVWLLLFGLCHGSFINEPLSSLLQWPNPEINPLGDVLYKINPQVECVCEGGKPLWDCEEQCGALTRLEGNMNIFSKGRFLMLLESKYFADTHHSEDSFQRILSLARTHSALEVYLYTYIGWAPGSASIRRWWEEQHAVDNRRPWQSSAGSFGGWGRSTLILIENGNIEWDMFDMIHSSKHQYVLDHFIDDHIFSSAVEYQIAQGDLSEALYLVSEEHDTEMVPFQICIKVANKVFAGNLSHNIQFMLDAFAEFCDDNAIAREEHTHGMDFEIYSKYARDLQILDDSVSMYDHAILTWKQVLSNPNSPINKNLVIHVALVPVYMDGLKDGHGVGERHESLLVSLCFFNSSIHEKHQLHTFYETIGDSGNHQVNTDVFLALLPCGDKSTAAILKSIKIIIAECRAGCWDEAGYTIAGIVFGAGIAGKKNYIEIQEFWSAVEPNDEYPADDVTHKMQFGDTEFADLHDEL